MKPISIAKIFKNNSGFSIIEILVALLLVSLVFLAIPTGDTTYKHRKLQETIDDIDRSIRFAANESVLRNVVVRLKLDFEKNPVEYTVEAGPKGELVLPEIRDIKDLNLDEAKKEKAKQQSFESQFTPVEDFKELSRPISQEVDIAGVATTYQKYLQKEGIVAIYFFPSGEKDDALFIFNTDVEIGTLEIEAFQEETKNQYVTIEVEETDKVKELRSKKIEELYQAWLK